MAESSKLGFDNLLFTTKKKRCASGQYAVSNKDLEKAGFLAYLHKIQSRGSEGRAVKRPCPRLSVPQHVSYGVRLPFRKRIWMLRSIVERCFKTEKKNRPY